MPNEPKWVEDMRRHYAGTGTFRADDIARVLGDPNTAVTASATSNGRSELPLVAAGAQLRLEIDGSIIDANSLPRSPGE